MNKVSRLHIGWQGVSAVMRVNLRFVFSLFVVIITVAAISFWFRCADVNKQDNNFYRYYRERDGVTKPHAADEKIVTSTVGTSVHVAATNQDSQIRHPNAIQYEEIDCLINDEATIIGRREATEVYLPFSFIAKYFEVYGKINQYDGYERFEWKHSYSKIYHPDSKYTTQSIFMSFEHYNVEVRDRVKCISGTEGVPISTQWGTHGYFYPIQIAEYGLSHYSKQLTERDQATSYLIDDAEKLDSKKWIAEDGDSVIENVMNQERGSRVIQFKSPESLDHAGMTTKITTPAARAFILDLYINFLSNGSLSVHLETKTGKRFRIHYMRSETVVSIHGNDIYYGMGTRTGWNRFTRDLAIDLQKGVMQRSRSKKKTKVSLQRVLSLTLRGKGQIDNIVLTNSAHMQFFHYAAQWLIKHQDSRGGWPIMVTRKLAQGRLELAPGWYSAMAQGQAMSVLARAFMQTKEKVYLEAALKAIKLFDIPSRQGGVLAMFMDRRPWYEEYPTTPSIFVLNGFIYSLLGLYDLKTVAPPKYLSDVERLYNRGMDSLKSMLPLFDTGTGSVYDLRHYTLGIAPNRARWDYHATHVNQLLLLSTIDDDPLIANTAKRWIGYMSGKMAAHN